MPFAVDGRWRATARPATVTGAVRDAGELAARDARAPAGAGGAARAGGRRPRSTCAGSRRASAPSRSGPPARESRRSGRSAARAGGAPPAVLSPRGVTPSPTAGHAAAPTRRRRPRRRAPRSLPYRRRRGGRGRRRRRTAARRRAPRLRPRRSSGCSRARSGRRPLRSCTSPGCVDVRRSHLDSAPLRVADERRRRIEPHRLGVQERAEELGRVVAAQPGRLVGEQAERRGVRLRKAEAGEADELVVDRVRRSARRSRCRAQPSTKRGAERLDRLLASLTAHRAAQPFGLPDAEPGRRPSRRRAPDPGRRRRRVSPGAARAATRARPEARSPDPRAAAAGARCRDGPPCPGSAPGRTSATWTVRSSRFSGRVRSRLCIWARLSIWKSADRVGRLDLGIDLRIVEWDP